MFNTASHIISETAVLLFSRSAKAEAIEKPLSGRTSRSDACIASTLIKHTKDTVKLSGLPLLVVPKFIQLEPTFGKKLSSAFEWAFAQGFKKIIAIGNDSPTLSPSHLLISAKHLQQHDVVLGPSADGGVYLIGMNFRSFDANLFNEFPWKTSRVFALLSQSFRGAQVLEVLAELDTKYDVHSFASASASALTNSLQFFLKQLLQETQFDKPDSSAPIHIISLSDCRLLRAPPFCP